MNNVCIVGRLTADPDLRTTSSGIEYSNFNAAVDRRFKNKETGEKTTDFIPCQAWRQTAVFINKYFHKGNMIAITGELHCDKYVDSDGNNRYRYYLSVDNVGFCGGKNESSASTNNAGTAAFSAPTTPNFEEIDDDVPF